MLNRPHPVFLILNLPIAALSVTVLIFATHSADAFAQSGPGGVDKEGEWHVGEGLGHGDYFHYTLCHVDYKECRNFEFEFWIKEDVAVGSETELLAEVLVRDGSKVVVGNMTLGKITLEPTGSSPELNNYRHAFGSSVTWLSAYAPADAPKAFSDASWGKISPIGGPHIIPTAVEDVTVPAGIWEDTVMVGWPMGNGYVSKMWVADGFPFPIKAETFLFLPVSPRPNEYEFELQNYGNLQESPFIGMASTSEQERAACDARAGGTVHIREATDGSKYEIRASYGPEYPEEGCWIGLSMEFLGRDGMLLEQVQFDVVVLDDDGGAARSIADELGSHFLYAHSGTYHLEFDVMESPGIAEYAIVVYGSAPDWVVPDQDERDALAIPVEVRPKAGTAMPGSDGNALANEAGHARAPLAQARDGVPAEDVECAGDRIRMTSPSGIPVCVFAGSAEALERRGFTLPSDAPNGVLSSKQPASEKADETGSQDVSKTGDRPFVTTWKTTSPSESITIPVGNATGTYAVSWGDGTTSPNVTGDQSHAYGEAGTYTVAITGNFEQIYLNGHTTNAPKLQSIEQWGDVSWTSMGSAFYGADNMVYNAADVPDLSEVTDMSCMFANTIHFDGDISNWDVSNVRNMSCMFATLPSSNDQTLSEYVPRVLSTAFNGDLSGWDVSGMTDMSRMFYGAISFNGDISDWDVSGVTDMSEMFHRANRFNGDISGWDVSGVTDMSEMFAQAYSFNGDLSDWDVSGVNDMSRMFHNAGSFRGDLSDWDVSGVTNMTEMFFKSQFFNSDLSDWDVSGVANMTGMFHSADSFNSDLSDWDVSGVANMTGMFHSADSFNSDLSDWDVSGVANMTGMFHSADSFNSDLSDWDVSGVTNMPHMFRGADSFNSDLSDWDVSGVTNMPHMFAETGSFNGDISSWDVSGVTDMSHMFRGADSFNGDISSWDVSSVTDMSFMFGGADSFNGDISDWDVSSVTDMFRMFYSADSFNGDISDWDVSSVKNMKGMLSNAVAFNGDISDWDVSGVTDMSFMFLNNVSFNGDISSWDVSSVTDMSGMFFYAYSFNQNLGNWYIVLDSTSIDIGGGATKIGNIAAQNPILDDQGPAYRMGSGADSDLFVIDGDVLMTKPSVDYSGKAGYAVNVTSTGDFGKNNFRVISVTVTGAGNTGLP